MTDRLAGSAGLHIDFASNALYPFRLICRNIAQHVLIARLFGDSQERRLHISRRTATVDIATGRLAVNAQHTERPFTQSVIGRNGVHLNLTLKKKIHIWGVDMISTDHPMNLPIGRFLGKGGLEHWQKVRAKTVEKFGVDQMDVLFPDSAYQLTHNALFPHDCIHVENLGGDIGLKELHNKRITLGVFPWKFKGGEAAFCRAVAWA